jgi:hypothetical protein
MSYRGRISSCEGSSAVGSPNRMERKVIQIAVERASEYNHTTLFALCEDGTMWLHEFDRQEDWHWTRIKGIPEVRRKEVEG